MIKRALLLLLLTAVWAFGSWWYYTCMIKGFCRANGVFTSAAERANTAALPATVAATGALALADSDADTSTETADDTKADTPVAPVTTTTDFIDADNDAISDETERSLGTDPENDDSDGDGIKDNIELGTDLKTPVDTDGDGIIDALDEDDDNDTISTMDETTNGTDPRSADSDADGLSDTIENKTTGKLGTDPMNPDSDGDGLNDAAEVGPDPETPIDTDNDGIIDALDDDDDNDGIPTSLELKLNSDPINADSDGDGIKDGDELGESGMPADTDGDGVIDLIDSTNDTPNDADLSAAPAEAPADDKAVVTDEPASDDEVTITSSEDGTDASANADITIQKSRLYFPFHSANPKLSNAATNYFKEVVQWLNSNPAHSVVLTGHTDDIGKAKNNLNLGLKRAVEIKNMMIKLGANATQIDVASMGETQPIANNKTESGRRKNRRVELVPLIK
jgi:outer membrane protein OmpA-like peptidoglycan-associated protein